MTKLGLAVSGAFLMSLVACGARPPSPVESPGATPSASAPSPKPESEPAAEPTSEPAGPTEPVPAVSKIECTRPSDFEPVFLDPASYARRRGASATSFSKIPTTKQEPIEACGVRGSLEALLRLRCDNGSNPFDGPEQAHDSRSGNVGPGGRCGSIVDLYKVPCPEQTYQVFIDMYVCPTVGAAS